MPLEWTFQCHLSGGAERRSSESELFFSKRNPPRLRHFLTVQRVTGMPLPGKGKKAMPRRGVRSQARSRRCGSTRCWASASTPRCATSARLDPLSPCRRSVPSGHLPLAGPFHSFVPGVGFRPTAPLTPNGSALRRLRHVTSPLHPLPALFCPSPSKDPGCHMGGVLRQRPMHRLAGRSELFAWPFCLGTGVGVAVASTSRALKITRQQEAYGNFCQTCTFLPHQLSANFHALVQGSHF